MGCGIFYKNISSSKYPLTFEQSLKVEQSDRSMFLMHGLIGEGGFGKVLTAVLVKTKKWYALKEINKVDYLVFVIRS
jgi:serine/threonine protein kinase